MSRYIINGQLDGLFLLKALGTPRLNVIGLIWGVQILLANC